MNNLAYLRVSTTHQSVQSQRLAILEYAREQRFQIDRFIEAKASGRATKKHRRLDDLMCELTAGDRVVVSELSRLARFLHEGCTCLLCGEYLAFRAEFPGRVTRSDEAAGPVGVAHTGR